MRPCVAASTINSSISIHRPPHTHSRIIHHHCHRHHPLQKYNILAMASLNSSGVPEGDIALSSLPGVNITGGWLHRRVSALLSDAAGCSPSHVHASTPIDASSVTSCSHWYLVRYVLVAGAFPAFMSGTSGQIFDWADSEPQWVIAYGDAFR